jgi:Patatin-like phospholipase
MMVQSDEGRGSSSSSNRVSVSPQQPSNGATAASDSVNPSQSAPSSINEATPARRPPNGTAVLRCAQVIVIPALVLILSGFLTQPQPFHGPFSQPPENNVNDPTSPLTLRQVLSDETTGLHLAMAPAFFGFYGYLGLLAAVPEKLPLRSVVGASAGALVAMVVACDIDPAVAMTFLSNVTLHDYADGPGWGAVFRGNRVEALLHQFLLSHVNSSTPTVLHMERARIPVAVTAFDLTTLTTRILRTGSMARAARASATFPGLFQPVAIANAVLMDGGVQDTTGTLALTEMLALVAEKYQKNTTITQRQRVLQLCVGRCQRPALVPGVEEWISISMVGLPLVGPWNSQGPRAYELARRAMQSALDVPLHFAPKRQSPARYHLTLQA